MGQENEQSKEGKKVEAEFLSLMSKLMSILKGDESLFKKPKVENKDLDELVQRITEERQKKVQEEFITKFTAIIDKKVEFDKAIFQEKKNFENKVLEKRKEFVKELKAVLNLVKDMHAIKGDYTNALTNLNGGDEAEDENPGEEASDKT